MVSDFLLLSILMFKLLDEDTLDEEGKSFLFASKLPCRRLRGGALGGKF